jgi:tetratricopeptide (TPR) repeat protein
MDSTKAELQERIAQFRKMAHDDPDNELGHFRLGQLLMEDGQYEDAARSLRRTVEVNPHFSKAYQLLGSSLQKLGRRDEALRAWREGYGVAEARGDRVPRDEMARLLTEAGEPPAASSPARPAEPGGAFRCQRPGCPTGGRGRPLPAPPMPDELGRRVQANVCADCWEEWLRGYSIKVINEMRLDLSTEHGQQVYDQVMKEFFGFE